MYINPRNIAAALATLVAPPLGSLRRVVIIGATLGLLLAPWTVLLQLGRAVDHVLFGRFRRVQVRAPVFVIANPRSGTTLLHRLLSLDAERFTSLTLWQTLLPSVLVYRLVAGIAAVDRVVGRPLGRIVHVIERLAFGGWDGVHNMGFASTEEEEGWFFLMWETPALWFAYPDLARLGHIGLLDEQPEAARRGAMRAHRTSVQRHLFATGTERTFLSKNVISSGRIRSLLAEYPDARFIYLLRDPMEALPSFASMFSMPWKVLAPRLPQTAASMWAELGVRFYEHALAVAAELPPERFTVVRYDDLVADPEATVHDLYERLGLSISADYAATLHAACRDSAHYERKHSYSAEQLGIDDAAINKRLAPLFARHGLRLDGADGRDAAQ
jgi:hypothetical protein